MEETLASGLWIIIFVWASFIALVAVAALLGVAGLLLLAPRGRTPGGRRRWRVTASTLRSLAWIAVTLQVLGLCSFSIFGGQSDMVGSLWLLELLVLPLLAGLAFATRLVARRVAARHEESGNTQPGRLGPAGTRG